MLVGVKYSATPRGGLLRTSHEAYRLPVRFAVLGPLEVSREEDPIPLGGPKQRIVLAHLVLSANQVVSAERLIDALWGEDLPEDPKSTLRVYVSRIRSSLGLDAIEARAPGYLLKAARSEVDALRFEDLLGEARANGREPRATDRILGEALTLWRGPALADLASEPSLEGEIARLEELRLQAIEEKMAAEIELGHHAHVVAQLESLTRSHPLRERLAGELMLALYRSDRQAEALAAYERARTILAEELGIDPSHELRQLHERILRQDPGLELQGEPLRGYRLLEQIGEGAFGVVYRATQPQIGREVAIKAVPPELANHPDFVRRFEREAQIVARLEHPHIVPLYDYWREPDAAYLIMRFLRGGSLEQLLAEGPLDTEQASRILDQVAAALSAAHRQGVVHRDVKPGNILLDEEGNAYLTDFGVALDAGAPEKASGTLMRGTPAYLSPEQIRLDPATPFSDVYALGIVLYEMLTAAHPFDETSMQALLDRHLRDPLPPVRATRPDLPPAIEDVIARATTKDTEARFSDALEVAAAFRAAVEDVPTLAQQAGGIRNPYKGLRAFLEADAADFFGREAVTERLLQRLEEDHASARFLAVVGPSGSGKSSVVRAGLVPALRRGALPGSERWYVIDLLPGAHPLRELESALLGVAVEPPPSLLDDLESDTLGLFHAADRVLPDPDAELVIVLDQLEELFTLVESEDERRHVLESIRAAADEPGSRMRFIATLRADFFDQPLSVRGFGQLLAEHTEPITPMAPEELERAIVAPADRAGLSVEPRLVAAMIADVVDRPGALPLLQFTLTELAERREDGVLTLAGYRKIGGVSGALARRAEHLYDVQNDEAREACRQLFLRMVTLGEGTEDTRRRVRRSELAPLAVPLAMDGVIETFGRYRLLSFDRDSKTREPTVEIAHEALLGGWSRLHDWVDEARDDIRAERRLAAAAAEWESNQRDPSFLLRGARLDGATAWIETSTLQPSAADRVYLDESLRVREAERAEEEARAAREHALELRSVRRMRGLVAVLAAAALVAATLTFVSVDQRRRAENASRLARDAATAQLAQRLGAQALSEEDLDLSLLLARQAVAIDNSPRTRSYLLTDLLRFPRVEGVMHGSSSAHLRPIALSPDGRTLAVGAAEAGGGLLFFDARTFGPIGEPLPVRGGVASVAYSPDGRRLAYGGDRVLGLIDARTREPLAAVSVNVEGDSGVGRIAFTPDGSQLVVVLVGRSRERISVRDATTLAATGPAIEPKGFVGAYVGSTWQAPGFAVTPDGRAAVIASNDDELVWWDLRSRTPTRRLEIGAGRHPLALSPDGRMAAVGIDGGFELLDTRTGARRKIASPDGTPSWLLFAPDGETVVSTGLDGTIALWDVPSGRLRETLRGHSGSVMQPVYSRDGRTLYTAGHDGTAIAWDIGGGRGLERRFTFTRDPVPDPNYAGHPGAFSPDGRLIALGLEGQGIRLWDAADLTPVGPSVLETGGEVKGLAFSPDGRTLAASALGAEITLWDVGSRSLLHRESVGGAGPWVDLAFSPDGRTLAVTSGSGVRLVDVATWTTVREIESEDAQRRHPFITPVFSADGALIATSRGFEGGADVWDATTGASILTVDAPDVQDPNDIVALSADGRTLAVGGWVGPVRIIDVRSGELVRELDPGTAGAFTLDLSPDGRVLAVGGWQPLAGLWDVPTGVRIGPAFTAGNERAWVDLSPDGRWLLLTHADGHGALYDVDPESWTQRACALANRTLTPEEWEEFLPGRPYEPACAT
jgi:WD40 repeat protein/DNA-binding SARP family transcriptional activator